MLRAACSRVSNTSIDAATMAAPMAPPLSAGRSTVRSSVSARIWSHASLRAPPPAEKIRPPTCAPRPSSISYASLSKQATPSRRAANRSSRSTGRPSMNRSVSAHENGNLSPLPTSGYAVTPVGLRESAAVLMRSTSRGVNSFSRHSAPVLLAPPGSHHPPGWRWQ